MSKDLFEGLTEVEKEYAMKILGELGESGESDILTDLYYADFDEIPVDIDTFLEDDRYVGKTTNQGKSIYPFWRDILRKLFAPESKYNEAIFSGCLSGDTLIPMLDGSKKTIKELYELYGRQPYTGKVLDYMYSLDMSTNRMTVGEMTRVFKTGIKPIYRITFDNGKYVDCSADHKFLTRDKHWKTINKGLSVGDSLMPFITEDDDKGYEILANPDGSKVTTHRTVMEYKIGDYKGVVHHKDFNKRNNLPQNLLKTTWILHRAYHRHHINKFNYDPEFQKKAHAAIDYKNPDRVRGVIEFNKNHPNIQNLLKKVSKEEMIATLKTLYNYKKLMNIYGLSVTGLESLLSRYEINPDDYVLKCPIKFPDKYWGPRFSVFSSLYNQHGYLDDDLVRDHGGFRCLPSNVVKNYFNGDEDAFLEVVKNYNHKIVSIELLGEQETYELTIRGHHNFALECGVISSNSIG